MEQENRSNRNLLEKEEEFKIQEVLFKYIKSWKWYVLTSILAISIAVLYLRYTSFKYEASATILIKDDSKGGGISELSAFEDLGIISGKSNLDNEIEIFKSRSLIGRVVKELKLNVAYFNESGPLPVRYFLHKPINILISAGDSSIYDKKDVFTITPLSYESYEISYDESGKSSVHKFGEEITTTIGKIVITPNFTKESPILTEITVKVSKFDDVVSGYAKNISISKVNKESNVINIALVGTNQDLSIAFIDNLIKQHGIDAIADKNEISENTSDFISDRMKFIASELSDVEGDVEKFKTDNKLVDVVSEAGMFLEANSENNQRILENEMQVRLSEFVYEYLVSHNDAHDLIPSNLGLSNPSIEKMIDSYNTLVLERNRLLKNSTEKNPVITNLEVQIMGIHKSLKESLANLKRSKEIQNNELRKTEKLINSKILSVPKYEREYREIQRQQQIKESLYLYLLQKREETAIALAATVGNTKIIDHAYGNKVPVSPKPKIIYLASLLIALIIPTGVIYLRDLLDTKVRTKKDILFAGLPYIGEIPLTENKKRNKMIVQFGGNDRISEAFRLLRTNIDFMLKAKPDSKNTIFITSTISKEGKSFVAVNLATILALSNKKVLLMGMDLRIPKIAEYTGIPEAKGITNYITNSSLQLKDIIITANEQHNFDILLSGNIPPNPAELLMHPRIKNVFDEAHAAYDYVIVDTAPVAAISDTLLISQYADATIYIAKAKSIDKRYLTIPETLMNEKKLLNLAVLLNGTDVEDGYGYGYGYGYGDIVTKKRWWNR